MTDLDILSEKGELVFKTDNGAIYQCDEDSIYRLAFFNENIEFRPCAFFAFRRKILKIDLPELLSSDGPDVALISLPHCDRLFVFSIYEIIELRELIYGATATLEMNSIIQRKLFRTVV